MVLRLGYVLKLSLKDSKLLHNSGGYTAAFSEITIDSEEMAQMPTASLGGCLQIFDWIVYPGRQSFSLAYQAHHDGKWPIATNIVPCTVYAINNPYGLVIL